MPARRRLHKRPAHMPLVLTCRLLIRYNGALNLGTISLRGFTASRRPFPTNTGMRIDTPSLTSRSTLSTFALVTLPSTSLTARGLVIIPRMLAETVNSSASAPLPYDPITSVTPEERDVGTQAMMARPIENSYGLKGINIQMKPNRGVNTRMDVKPNRRLFPDFKAVTSSVVSVVKPKMKKMTAMLAVVTTFHPFTCKVMGRCHTGGKYSAQGCHIMMPP